MAMEITQSEIERRIIKEPIDPERKFVLASYMNTFSGINDDNLTTDEFMSILRYNRYILVFSKLDYFFQFDNLSKTNLTRDEYRYYRFSGYFKYDKIKDLGVLLNADGLCFESRLIGDFGATVPDLEEEIVLVESIGKIKWRNARCRLFRPGFNTLSLPDNDTGKEIYNNLVSKLETDYDNIKMEVYNIDKIVLYDNINGKYYFDQNVVEKINNSFNSIFVINIDQFARPDIGISRAISDFVFMIHKSSILNGNMIIFTAYYNTDIIGKFSTHVSKLEQISVPKSISYLSDVVIVYKDEKFYILKNATANENFAIPTVATAVFDQLV